MQQAALLALVPFFIQATGALYIQPDSYSSAIQARSNLYTFDDDVFSLLYARMAPTVPSGNVSPGRTEVPYQTANQGADTVGNKVAGNVDKFTFHGDPQQTADQRKDNLAGTKPDPTGQTWRDDAHPASTIPEGPGTGPGQKYPGGDNRIANVGVPGQRSEAGLLGTKSQEAQQNTGGRAQATYDGMTLDQARQAGLGNNPPPAIKGPTYTGPGAQTPPQGQGSSGAPGNVVPPPPNLSPPASNNDVGGHNLRQRSLFLNPRSTPEFDLDVPIVLSRREVNLIARSAAADAVAEALYGLKLD